MGINGCDWKLLRLHAGAVHIHLAILHCFHVDRHRVHHCQEPDTGVHRSAVQVCPYSCWFCKDFTQSLRIIVPSANLCASGNILSKPGFLVHLLAELIRALMQRRC